MTTRKQINANRQNAVLSTGPRSFEGKHASSKNAVRHGILSPDLLTSDEDPEMLSALIENLVEEFDPCTPMEFTLVEKLAICLWRDRRLAKTETQLIEAHRRFSLTGKSTKDFLPVNKQMLIGRYQTMINRQIFSTLEQLRKHKEQRINSLTPCFEAP